MRSIHYSIPLPYGYDMSRIEDRALSKARRFHALPGLQFKAFLSASVTEGARRNLYAPFYIWDGSQALAEFLTGPLFGSVIGSFGRPAVHDHQVLQFGIRDPEVVPSLATFERMYADRFAQPREIWRWERWAQRQAMECRGLFAACSSLDPASWMVTRARFWADPSAVRGVAPGAERLRVLAVIGSATSVAVAPVA